MNGIGKNDNGITASSLSSLDENAGAWSGGKEKQAMNNGNSMKDRKLIKPKLMGRPITANIEGDIFSIRE